MNRALMAGEGDEDITLIGQDPDLVPSAVVVRNTPTRELVQRLGKAVHGLSAFAVLLVVVWFGGLDKGFSWTQGDAAVFSWHPLLMTLGMLVCFAEAVISYRAFEFVDRPKRKQAHLALHSMALCFTLLGLIAVFRFHNEATPPIPNMYSLHSWVGLLTALLFLAQFALGFLAFWKPKLADAPRAAFVPVHAGAGQILFLTLVTATICMGVLEKLTFGKDCNTDGQANSKCYVGNVFALTALALAGVVSMILLLPKP